MKYRDDLFELTLILAIMLVAVLVMLCCTNAFNSIFGIAAGMFSIFAVVGVMIQLIDSMDEDIYESQEIEG